MELEQDLWLVGPYYIDIDQNGQLRIVGPNNHLYFGSVGLFHNQITVLSAKVQEGEVVLELDITLPNDFLPDPAMGHIRLVQW